MEPDLIGYCEKEKKLYLGESTTSGYMGQHGKDYHVGAVKKVSEAFSKFYLFHDNKNNIIEKSIECLSNIVISSINCYFIVPKGSRFINSLGWREKLFKTGHMKLDIVKLTEESYSIMIKVLNASMNENRV